MSSSVAGMTTPMGTVEVGAVVGEHGLGRGVETYLALDDLAQAAFEAAEVDDRRNALAAMRAVAGPGGPGALASVAGLGHKRRFRGERWGTRCLVSESGGVMRTGNLMVTRAHC